MLGGDKVVSCDLYMTGVVPLFIMDEEEINYEMRGEYTGSAKVWRAGETERTVALGCPLVVKTH